MTKVSSRPDIGTHDWCERFGARLDAREKLVVVRMLIRAQLRDLGERGLLRLSGAARAPAQIDLDRVVIPDSTVARDAERYAEGSYSPVLLLHCYRTYFWGALLGQGDGLAVDHELLFVASLLHDLGICERNMPNTEARCFATTGAREASAFVLEKGWSSERALQTYEAVSLHLNPIVEATVHGAEAKLVGDGATMDVLGSRYHRVPTGIVRSVHARYPRTSFRGEILVSVGAPHAPSSRPHFLSRLGFGFFANRNPLDRSVFAPHV